MERFEINIVAQGSDSIWIALAAITLLCAIAESIVYLICNRRFRVTSNKKR
jgi:hypothetical protein